MEKITKTPITDIPTLSELANDDRERDDFMYRYVYDHYVELNGIK
jgi:hypothetical protein